MSNPIPTLREYGEYLESLDRPLDVEVLLALERDARGNSDAAVLDLGISPGRRSGRRRRLVVAAVAAAFVAIAATVFVQRRDHDALRVGVPAAPTSVSSSPGFDALMNSNARTGNTPDTELVASAWFGGDLGAYLLYADGRLLWLDDHGGTLNWVVRRLTPEGVEHVRSEFFATGLFDDGVVHRDDPADSSCGAVFALLCVRDGDHLLRRAALSGPGTGAAAPPWSPEEQVLRDRLVALPSSLPPTAWKDQEPTAYASAKYAVCITAALPRGPQSVNPDPSEALKALPSRAEKLLTRNGGKLSLVLLWGGDRCFGLTTVKAQALARDLVDAFGPPDPGSRSEARFELTADVDRKELERFGITFTQLLPHGEMAMYYAAWA